MYKSEAAFSRALRSQLKSLGLFVSPIETGQTTQGVPDLFIVGNKTGDIWLELKNSYYDLSNTRTKVAWRPGQQAWHNTYKRLNKNKLVYTIISHKTGFIIIKMNKIYKENIIETKEHKQVKTIKALASYIKEL